MKKVINKLISALLAVQIAILPSSAVIAAADDSGKLLSAINSATRPDELAEIIEKNIHDMNIEADKYNDIHSKEELLAYLVNVGYNSLNEFETVFNDKCSIFSDSEKLRVYTDSEKVYISGNNGNHCADTPISVSVSDIDGNICFIRQVMSDADGEYSVEVSKENMPEDSEYIIRESTLYGITDKKISALSQNREEEALSQINSAATAKQLQEVLERYKNDLFMNCTEYMLLVDSTETANTLVGNSYSSMGEFCSSAVSAANRYVKSKNSTAVYHVAPNGSDKSNASELYPTADISSAVAMVSEDLNKYTNFKIVLDDGAYSLTEAVNIDFDLNGKSLVLASADGAAVTVSGDIQTPESELYRDNIYKVKLDSEQVGMVYENGSMMTNARYPNKEADRFKGFLIAHADDTISRQAFKYDSLPKISDTDDLEAYVWSGGSYRKWVSDTIGVKELDTKNKRIVLESEAAYEMADNSQFFIQGAIELLDEPGEYYYDSSERTLYYIPTEDNSSVSVSCGNDLLVLKNTQNVTVEGITFKNCAGNAITIDSSDSCTVKNCNIINTNNNGICLMSNSSYNTISGNTIKNAGFNGIYFIGDNEKSSVKTSCDNLIYNNDISDTGLLYGAGSGISVGIRGASGNKLMNNRIRNTSRYGVNTTYTDFENTIQFNDISNCNIGSNDTGMIYGFGSKNIRVIGNYLHDSDFKEGGAAIYYDDGCENIDIINNVVESCGGTKQHSVFLIKGSNVRVLNNIAVNNTVTEAVLATNPQFNRVDNLDIVYNVFYNSGNIVQKHYDFGKTSIGESGSNLYYDSAEAIAVTAGNIKSFAEWRNGGYDTDSVITDDAFITAEKRNYKLSDRAIALGMHDIDIEEIGLKHYGVEGIVTDNENGSSVKLNTYGRIAVNVIAVCAEYEENGNFVRIIDSRNITVGEDGAKVDFAFDRNDGKIRKIFVWNSLIGMKPYEIK